jgi:hypothetical protein
MSKADEDRARRLAEALRHNLRRRKAQARGQDAGSAIEPLASSPPARTPDAG